MSDVIKDARQLLEGATPGPWEWEERKYRGNSDCHHDWLGSEHGTALVTFDSEEYSSWVESADSDKALIAAAPELAQALAEEAYQYGVTYTGVKHGGHHIEWVESTGDAEWDKETLQLLVKHWKNAGQSPKVVRRRVSPPEVINEEL